MVTFDQISPIVLIGIFVGVLYFFGLITALVVMGISGTISLFAGIAIKARKLPKIDDNWDFHDRSSGVFIKKREGQIQYASIICAALGGFALKGETLIQMFSFFTGMPIELQGGYVLGSHVVGYALAATTD